MVMLYGRHYFARYQVIADLIPARSSVLDLCRDRPYSIIVIFVRNQLAIRALISAALSSNA